MYKQVAILIDGGFFIQRVNFYLRKFFPEDFIITEQQFITLIWRIVKFHIEKNHGRHEIRSRLELYRIYFYDCSPPVDQIKFPLPDKGKKTPSNFNLKNHPPYQLRAKIHNELRKNRKTALRLGSLSKTGTWQLTSHSLKKILQKEIKFEDLTNDDFFYERKQKAVDIKLGIDIATLSYKKLVQSIVLIAGDSDFVPSSKLARLQGIDFILDPMEQNISDDLSEHVDGIQSCNIIKAIHEICNITPKNTDALPWWKKYKQRYETNKKKIVKS